jgi:hypothetical protein
MFDVTLENKTIEVQPPRARDYTGAEQEKQSKR